MHFNGELHFVLDLHNIQLYYTRIFVGDYNDVNV